MGIETRLKIAIWLTDVRISSTVYTLPVVLPRLFDAVFGGRALSRRRIVSTIAASSISFGISRYVLFRDLPSGSGTILGIIITILPTYLALFQTRMFLGLLRNRPSWKKLILILFADIAVTSYIGVAGVEAAQSVLSARLGGYTISEGVLASSRLVLERVFLWGNWFSLRNYLPLQTLAVPGTSIFVPPRYFVRRFYLPPLAVYYWPPFVTSLWIWACACSGLLIRFARRFDVVFPRVFNLLDPVEKPLQSIGLILACGLTLIYLTYVVLAGLL